MAGLLSLPLEIHGRVFDYLDLQDRRALVGSCRTLRQWRELVWRRIEIRAEGINAFVRKLEALLHMVTSVTLPSSFIQDIFVFAVGGRGIWQHDRTDAVLAQILQLCQNVRSFVLSTPSCGSYHSPRHTLEAMTALPHLREVTIAYAPLTNPGQFRSKSLEKVVLSKINQFDLANFFKDQSHLKSLHFSVNGVSNAIGFFKVAPCWNNLKELGIISNRGGKWLAMIDAALKNGGLRKLEMLSVETLQNQHEISTLACMLQLYGVPVTKLRVKIDGFAFQAAGGFSASGMLYMIERLPELETLCIDYSDPTPQTGFSIASLPWSGLWMGQKDYCAAFGSAKRLKTLIMPGSFFLIIVRGASNNAAALAKARMVGIQSLMSACPTLDLMVYGDSPRYLYHRKVADPISSDSTAPSGGSTYNHRFWVPEEGFETGIILGFSDSCCTLPSKSTKHWTVG